MSRLVRLYPAAWRARYEAELLDALTFRPLTLRDRFDLVRGALDARVHPELAGSRVGAPVPVGPDTGGGIPMSPDRLSRGPHSSASLRGLAFALSALLLLVDTWFIGGEPFPSALLTVGAASLGAATWRTGSRRARRLDGHRRSLRPSAWPSCSARSPSAGFAVVILLVTGTLVRRRHGRSARASGPDAGRVAARGIGLIVLGARCWDTRSCSTWSAAWRWCSRPTRCSSLRLATAQLTVAAR